MYKFGPYGPNHSTAATFAFRTEYLQQSSFQDDAALAEEKHFLKNYTTKVVQMDPLKTILVFSHVHNTFDKKKLLNDGNLSEYVKETTISIDDFIKNESIKDFFMNKIDDILDNYYPGKIENKPDVLKQIEELTAKRQKMIEEHTQKNKEAANNIPPQFINKINQQQDIIKQLLAENKELKDKNEYLENKMKEMIQSHIKKIQQQQQQQQSKQLQHESFENK
jgi:hypothetical protein